MQSRPVFVTDLDFARVKDLFVSLGEPAYRAEQLLAWIYKKRAASFEEMTDFPVKLREKLKGEIQLTSVKPIHIEDSRDGSSKALLALYDGRNIETALIPSYTGAGSYTVCVSSQVGCANGCPFCATARQGFERNLSSGEIIDQVLYFARRLGKKGVISNVVFMGMGEPLANYPDVVLAVERINASWGFGLGARDITISTAGWVPGIEKLSNYGLQVGLAVSLHASNDLLRSRLVPLNRKYPLLKLIPACREYVRLTGRRVSFEYCLFAGVNDSPAQARELAHLLHGINCHVNLIAANDTGDLRYKAPPLRVILAFENELKTLGINATLRKSYGSDINAACGQLKSMVMAKSFW
jgi:23S rRNA (adenine2503-C2)-methyltransferase